MWTTVLLVLLIPSSVFAQLSRINCEPLDPRAKIAKETETKINASVRTVYKIAQAGGEIERKAKEEIQNLPSGATGKDQIEARWIYLFCEMLRTSGDLSEAQKKQSFDAVIRATKSTSQAPSAPKPKEAKGLVTASKTPNISILGALPIHLWEKRPGPEKRNFVHHRIALIAKIHNKSNFPVRINVAVLEGCVPVSIILLFKEMLIEGETLPEPMKFDEALGELQKTTIQRIRLSGTIRQDARDVPAFGTSYVGILFPLALGSGGVAHVIPGTVTTKGKCEAIKIPNTQPSVSQLLQIGHIHTTFPQDLIPEFRDGRINIRLHIGSEGVQIDPKLIGEKLYSVSSEDWPSLLLPEMYEVPDDLYPPRRK
jgi:hypothetical protein